MSLIASFLDSLFDHFTMPGAERIDVRLSKNRCVFAKFYVEGTTVYRIPYRILKLKQVDVAITNPFIVYILVGTDESGEECIYVGKSKNGIENRPLSHEDKGCNWDCCYVITEKDDSFLNDGVIQYLEDQICSRVNLVGRYKNTTKVTNSDTVNDLDRYSGDKLMEKAFLLLDVLGLDLIIEDDEQIVDVAPVPATPAQKRLGDLRLDSKQLESMTFIRDSLLGIDACLRIAYNDSSWNYMRVSFYDKNKALVYYRGLRDGTIKCYIQGESDFFSDADVVPTAPGEVYGSCHSVFIVKNMGDAKKLIGLCRKAYNHQYSRK